MTRIITWHVSGMHCTSCERVIEQELAAIPGVTEAEVSIKQQRAGIQYQTDSEPNLSEVFEKLKKLGYTFERENTSNKEIANRQAKTPTIECALPTTKAPLKKRLTKALIALGITAFIAIVFLNPILKLVPTIDASASVLALFGFGIVASLSSCLASTGGYLLAFSSKKPSRSRTIAIHAGRLASFTLGGAILGSLGQQLPALGGGFYGTLALILGIGFLFAGLNLLELTPSLAMFGIRLPKNLSRIADRIATSEKSFTPFLVGASTFILPCGFTQTVQALALTSSDPIKGMFMMLFFALGTLPVLGGLTAFGTLATLKHHTVKLVIGSILVLFAISQINGGLTVLGSPITPGTLLTSLSSEKVSTNKNTNIQEPSDKKGEQTLKMAVTSSGYEPSSLTVKVGIPVRWEIDGQAVGGCTRDIVVPSLHIEKTLTKGSNLITFTPQKTGTIPFSCGMGMVRGSITVIN